ncbi:MAG: hypothetical protein GQ582_04280 [Methyloprofundus sp.]|nr:hypothetical protein [Methyloprofundus sp.]
MSACDKLDQKLQTTEDFRFYFSYIDHPEKVTIQCYPRYGKEPIIYSYLYTNSGAYTNTYADTDTVQEVLAVVAKNYKGYQPDLLSLSVRVTDAKISNVEMKQLVMQAICEIYQRPCPDDAELKAMKKAKLNEQKSIRESNIALLQQSDTQAFNALSTLAKKKAGHYRKTDLSATKLIAISLAQLNFQDSLFDQADLSKADLSEGQFKAASFKNAQLAHASGTKIKAAQADFSDAKMDSIDFIQGMFKEAKFNRAKLTHANLNNCNLLGADFTEADLSEANLQFSRYDDDTIFPEDFIPPDSMVWKGTGESPGIIKRRAVRDNNMLNMMLEDFMQALVDTVEASRLDKALKMLKKSSFDLYTQVNEEGITGVIKSQSDSELVYSCHLSSAGKFCCCTQNLNTCGGLRGKPCKHLLVLIIGLAKNQEIDPRTMYQWLDNSRDFKPELDHELMSEVLLRYKGAQAGELDWRPSETVPEDYYLF